MTDRYYIPMIASICDVENIDLGIPTIDDEVPILSRVLQRFAQSGIAVAVSSKQIVAGQLLDQDV